MRNSIALFGAAAAMLLLPSACNHENAAQTTLSGAVIVTADHAVALLTARRCQREFDCKNLGAGKRYADNAACEREVAQDLQSEMRPAVCPYGVREDKLIECQEELRNEKCGNQLDTVSHLATCNTGRICLH